MKDFCPKAKGTKDWKKLKNAKKGDEDFWKIIAKLKNLGDYNHNVKVVQQKYGNFVVLRRPKNYIPKYTGFLPCVRCLGFVQIHMLGHHEKVCGLKKEGEKNLGQVTLKQRGQFKMMQDIGVHSFEMKSLLSKMKLDPIGLVVREDPVILELGQLLLDRKNIKAEAIDSAKQQMRTLARILIEMRRTPGNESRNLQSFIRPIDFQFYINTIKEMTINSERFQLALNFGYTMKKISEICWTRLSAEGETQAAQNCEIFLKMYKRNFHNKVGSQVLKSKNDKHHAKVPIMIKDKDVKKLTFGLLSDIQKAYDDLLSDENQGNWRKLITLLLVYLLAYNRKRAGDMAKTKLVDFQNAKIQNLGHDPEELSKLTKMERAIAGRHTLMRIKAKKGRHVPVLIPKGYVEASMDLIVEKRESVGKIDPENEYFFANSKDSYLQPYPRIKKAAERYELSNPSAIKSTLLRRHLATAIQVLNIPDNLLDGVARFMGHDLNVHRNYYRLSNHVTDCTKIATIFMAAQDGTLSKNSGQTADQLLENYVPLDNDEDNEDSSDDEEIDVNDPVSEEEEGGNVVQKVRRRLPGLYGKAMFDDPIIKPLMEAGINPKTEHFLPFLEKNPLPEGFTLKFLVEKCKTKNKQEKKRQENKSQKEKKRKEQETKKKNKKGRTKKTDK